MTLENNSNRGAQTPCGDAQLMQRLRFARLRRDLMPQQRFKAGRDRFARRVGDGLPGRKRHPARRRIGARVINHGCYSLRADAPFSTDSG